MEVNRTEVVKKLEAASIAVTSNPILEQSDSFVFSNGSLVTFDGELCTRQESPFGTEIEGGITAADMLKVLQRFPDEMIRVEQRGEELIIKGKRRSAGIRMQEVRLPFDGIIIPEKFKSIPEGLKEALKQAIQVCGTDESAPKTTHVHIAPDRVESTDSYRLFRADIKTGVKNSVMVHAVNLVRVCKIDIQKMQMGTDGWLHFKTADNMVISLLCSADEYYSKEMIDRLLAGVGEEIALPTDMADIVSRAETMTNNSVGGWDSRVSISLAENVMRVESRKDEGWFRESKKVQYEGPPLAFSINPAFLKDLIFRTTKAIVTEKQIKVNVENIHFTAVLELPETGDDD